MTRPQVWTRYRARWPWSCHACGRRQDAGTTAVRLINPDRTVCEECAR